MALFETKAEAMLKVLYGMGICAAGAGVVAIGYAAVKAAGEEERREAALDALLRQRVADEAAAAEQAKALAAAEKGAGAFRGLLANADDETKKALAPVTALLNGEVTAARDASESAGRQLQLTSDRIAVRAAPGRLFA